MASNVLLESAIGIVMALTFMLGLATAERSARRDRHVFRLQSLMEGLQVRAARADRQPKATLNRMSQVTATSLQVVVDDWESRPQHWTTFGIVSALAVFGVDFVFAGIRRGWRFTWLLEELDPLFVAMSSIGVVAITVVVLYTALGRTINRSVDDALSSGAQRSADVVSNYVENNEGYDAWGSAHFATLRALREIRCGGKPFPMDDTWNDLIKDGERLLGHSS